MLIRCTGTEILNKGIHKEKKFSYFLSLFFLVSSNFQQGKQVMGNGTNGPQSLI